jgi:chromosome segregation ATPase
VWFFQSRRTRETAAIVAQLSRIEGKVDRLMASEADLQTDLDTIKAGVATVVTKLTDNAQLIADLKAQVEAGVPVSQEQLDALHAEASGIARPCRQPSRRRHRPNRRRRKRTRCHNQRGRHESCRTAHPQ